MTAVLDSRAVRFRGLRSAIIVCCSFCCRKTSRNSRFPNKPNGRPLFFGRLLAAATTTWFPTDSRASAAAGAWFELSSSSIASSSLENIHLSGTTPRCPVEDVEDSHPSPSAPAVPLGESADDEPLAHAIAVRVCARGNAFEQTNNHYGTSLPFETSARLFPKSQARLRNTNLDPVTVSQISR